MTRLTWLLAAAIVCWGPLARAGDGKPVWEKKTYTNAKGEQLPYRLLLPEDHDPKKAYPLLVFMSGVGARGTDNEAQIKGTPWFVAARNRKKYPCFVLAPQCPGTKTIPYWNQCVRKGLVMGAIEEVEKNHRIDPARVYATGLSDGGYGVWHLLDVYPDRFAAAVPISVWECPVPAAKIAHVPLWAFHGEKDKPRWTREMIEALKKAGGKPKYTEYPNAGHGVWDRAYSDPKLFEWLFAQKKGDKASGKERGPSD